MNDNKKSPLDEALDAVAQAGDVKQDEYDEALKGLRGLVEEGKQKKKKQKSVH